jgi:hypothetical protein
MSRNHEELVHKTYQALFIIYAPIALISILVKFFSNTYISYLYVTALLVAAVSILIGLVMCIQFWHHRKIISRDKEVNIPVIVRHRFMIIYIPITIISLLISSYYTFDKYVKSIELYGQGQQTEISILFPLRNELGAQQDDAEQARMGLGAFMVNSPEYSDSYHLTIFDHQNKYSATLENKVISKIDKGVKYFICTYSDVCSELATKFDSILERTDYSTRPILITTLSSAMNLPLEKDKFYRFYVRNREDARVLAKAAYEKGIKKASFIASNDSYGLDASQAFSEAWIDFGGDLIEGVYVDPNLTADVVANRVRQSHLTSMKKGAIFVAHYQNINKSLELLDHSTLYLLSANYQQNIISELSNNIPKEQLVFAIPRYKATHPKLNNTAASFIYMTLMKLVHVDQQIKGDTTQFHPAWQQDDYPGFLEFRTDGVADFRIEMEAYTFGADIHTKKLLAR